MKLATVMRCAAATAAAVGIAGRVSRIAGRHPDRVHRGRAEDLKKYAARFNEDHPDIEIKWVRDSTGIVTAKLPGEGQSQGRRHLGAGRDEPPAHEVGRHAAPVRAPRHRTTRSQVRRQGRPACLDGHGRMGRVGVREHGGAGQARIRDTCFVEGPHQARVQGARRDAEPELVGHRLPRRLELAADVRRGGWLAVHGRAAREHPPPTRIPAPSPASRRRAAKFRLGSRSHSAARSRKRAARRSTSSFRPRASAGTWKPLRSCRGRRTWMRR